GDLPIPEALAVATDDADPSRSSVRWRLRLGAALTLVLVGLGAADAALPDAPIRHALGRLGLLVVQAALCVPVVFVCGWPILSRAWRSIRTRRIDVYTLVGLGLTAAFVFSMAALLYEALALNVLPKPGNPAD